MVGLRRLRTDITYITSESGIYLRTTKMCFHVSAYMKTCMTTLLIMALNGNNTMPLIDRKINVVGGTHI